MTTYSKPKRMKTKKGLSSVWYSRVNDNGRRTWRSTGTTDYQEARRAVARWQLDDVGTPSGLTLEALVGLYLTYQSTRVRPLTLYTQTSRLRRLVCGVGANTLAKTVTTQLLEGYLANRKVNGATKNASRRVFRTFFAWAVRSKLLATNPAAGLVKYHEDHNPKRAIPPEEQARLLEAAAQTGADVHAWAMVALHSGLRYRTLSELTWADVDLEAGEWRIPAAKMKARRGHSVPLSEPLRAFLRARAGEPDAPILPPWARERWVTAAALAGCPDVRLHHLRVAFLNNCRRAGVSLEAAMELGAWTDIQVVLRHYRQVQPAELREELQRVFPSPAVASPCPTA